MQKLFEAQRVRIRDQLQWIRIAEPNSVFNKHRVWINPELTTKTMAIHEENGTLFIRYSRTFVEKLTDRNIYDVLVHEAEHIRRRHSDRCRSIIELLSKEEIVRLFNIGADLEVNQEVKCIGNALQVGKGNYTHYQAGLTAEQYFVCVLHDHIKEKIDADIHKQEKSQRKLDACCTGKQRRVRQGGVAQRHHTHRRSSRKAALRKT